jgi:hypothetical protein
MPDHTHVHLECWAGSSSHLRGLPRALYNRRSPRDRYLPPESGFDNHNVNFTPGIHRLPVRVATRAEKTDKPRNRTSEKRTNWLESRTHTSGTGPWWVGKVFVDLGDITRFKRRVSHNTAGLVLLSNRRTSQMVPDKDT